MKENKIKEISQLTNVSVATVKRALGNYAGISSETKQKVLATAEQLNYSFKPRKVDLGIVLPVTPSSFWGVLRQQLDHSLKAAKLNYRIFFYPELLDGEGALHCLEAALGCAPAAMIASLPSTDSIKRILTDYSKDRCLVLLEEPLPIPGACFVGENSYREGYRLAQAYFLKYPRSRTTGIFNPYAHTADDRISGFLDAMKELCGGGCAVQWIGTGNCPYSKIKAVNMARQIENCTNDIDVILYSGGELDLLHDALLKIRPKKRIDIIGFDTTPKGVRAEEFGAVRFALRQNLKQQAQLAAETAIACLTGAASPEEKRIYVENDMVEPE